MRKLVILIFILPLIVQAQQLAFPGAEGFGRYTTGGRGGDVYIVTNLTDSLKHPEKGSLRWAIKKKGPRTIVFAVSGTIPLQGPLKVKHGDLTIAGQTAPGDGICLRNYTFRIEADNVIVRYMRFRCGDAKLESSAQDAANGRFHKDIIIDHCSMSWSIDETGSFYDNKNFTMQWCILSESLYHSGHEKGDHGYGGIWGGAGATFHHNLLADHTSRNPRFNGSRFTTTSKTELVDFRNNVIFNWGFNSVYGGEDGQQNMVNNYFKAGPATQRNGELPHRILQLTQEFYNKDFKPDTLHAGLFYIDGNYVDGYPNATKDNWMYGVQKATEAEKAKSRVDKPFPFAPVETQTAEDAYRSVLKHVGATLPKRDAVDQRIIKQVETGVCHTGGVWGPNTGIIDSQKSVGGWPELKSKRAPKDTDKDGMPDFWELKHGLDPKNPMDGNLDMNDDGYTNLEDYLNKLAGR